MAALREDTLDWWTDPLACRSDELVEGEEPGVAEFERELIRPELAKAGSAPKARGVKLGPKFKLTAHQKQEALARRAAGEAQADIARTYNVSHSTISRLTP
jgi:DNA invertase Pin-like site-specific DNA recombinase